MFLGRVNLLKDSWDIAPLGSQNVVCAWLDSKEAGRVIYEKSALCQLHGFEDSATVYFVVFGENAVSIAETLLRMVSASVAVYAAPDVKSLVELSTMFISAYGDRHIVFIDSSCRYGLRPSTKGLKAKPFLMRYGAFKPDIPCFGDLIRALCSIEHDTPVSNTDDCRIVSLRTSVAPKLRRIDSAERLSRARYSVNGLKLVSAYLANGAATSTIGNIYCYANLAYDYAENVLIGGIMRGII